MKNKLSAEYRVDGGRLFVNGDLIPVNPHIMKIGLASAGLDASMAGIIPERLARRILDMERSLLLSILQKSIDVPD